MYGTARYDDITNEIMFAATTGASSNYRNVWYYFIDAETGKIKYTTKLRPGYFFPSIPVIVDRYAPEFIDFDNITVSLADGEQNIDLSNIVIDRDDINYNIEVTLDNSEVKGIATVGLDGKSLYINPLKEGDAKITLYAISRGVITEHEVALSVTSESGVSRQHQNKPQTAGLGHLRAHQVAHLGHGQFRAQRKTKRGEGMFTVTDHVRDLTFTPSDGAVTVEGIVSCVEPVVNPELLTAAVRTHLPECTPDGGRFCRMALYRADGTAYR